MRLLTAILVLGAISVGSALPGAAAPASTGADRTLDQRNAFLEAVAALDRDPDGYETRRRQLDGYVLAPYLDYARLRRELRTLDSSAARRFLDGEAASALGAQFRREYLAELARRGDWPALLRFDTDAGDGNRTLRCHRVRALLATGRTADARSALLDLWPTGESLPEACDEPIAIAQERGWLGSKPVWERLRLAVAAGNPGLARYLARMLPARQRVDGELLARAIADPEATLQAAAGWADAALQREAAGSALRRRARTDIDSALDHWERLAPRFEFTPEERAAIVHDLALYAAVDYRHDAGDLFERVPMDARSEQLADWQLRAALAAQDWATVLKVTGGLPEELAAAARSRYWRARALDRERRDAEARAGYEALAVEANFHGFLAADRIEAPYSICPRDLAAGPGRLEALRRESEIARALELHAVGWREEARRAWEKARATVSDSDRPALAAIASQQGWHERVVFALNTGDDTRHYALRFPLAERETVERESARNGLDPAWTYALIRAESAWQPDARSHADALGLMQLLPATGRRMARQLDMTWQGSGMLLDAQTNIRLGTRYLAQQLERFDGSPWLASAAYNAGPTPVQRWLDERGSLPADIFIETIPYRETRDYVTRVLAFSVIYDWRLDGKTQPLSSRLARPGKRAARTDGARQVICAS